MGSYRAIPDIDTLHLNIIGQRHLVPVGRPSARFRCEIVSSRHLVLAPALTKTAVALVLLAAADVSFQASVLPLVVSGVALA